MTSRYIEKCELTNCEECKRDNSVCSRCIEGFELLDNLCSKIVYRIETIIRTNPEDNFYVGTDASFVITFNDTAVAKRGDFYLQAKDFKDSLFYFELTEVSSSNSVRLTGHLTRIASPRI